MMRTLLEKLINGLKCHLCFRQMTPPLIQCSKGFHLFCSECIKLCKNYCFECRKSVKDKRHRILEKLCFGILLKCSFEADGCQFEGVAVVVVEHEHFCDFRSKNCPVECNGGIVMTVVHAKDANEHDVSRNRPQFPFRHQDTPGQLKQREVILAECECPVCKETISPPVLECKRGHLLCKDCFLRMKNCPVCRCSLSSWRNVIMERVIFEIKKPVLALRHKISCQFHPKCCPLMWNRRCHWQGSDLQAMVDHCSFSHFHDSSRTHAHAWVLHLFPKNRPQCSTFKLFFAHNEVFRCGWDTFEAKIIFSVYRFENAESVCRYKYNMYIFLPDSAEVGVSVEDLCMPIRDGSVRFVDGNYKTFSTQTLNDLVNSDGTLRYLVTIVPENSTDVQ